MVDSTNKGSNIGVVPRPVHLKDCIDALFPRPDSFWSHPEPQEVCLFQKSLTLEWVAFHVVGVKSG